MWSGAIELTTDIGVRSFDVDGSGFNLFADVRDS